MLSKTFLISWPTVFGPNISLPLSMKDPNLSDYGCGTHFIFAVVVLPFFLLPFSSESFEQNRNRFAKGQACQWRFGAHWRATKRHYAAQGQSCQMIEKRRRVVVINWYREHTFTEAFGMATVKWGRISGGDAPVIRDWSQKSLMGFQTTRF